MYIFASPVLIIFYDLFKNTNPEIKYSAMLPNLPQQTFTAWAVSLLRLHTFSLILFGDTAWKMAIQFGDTAWKRAIYTSDNLQKPNTQ